MESPPEFLAMPPIPIGAEEIFRPAVTSRRGEFAAWTGVLALAVLSLVMGSRTHRFPGVAFILLVFFLLAAVYTSLGAFIDRRTSICLDPGSLTYSSPLRTVRFGWGEVEEVRVVPAGQGWRVVIRGGDRQWHFRIVPEAEGTSSESFPAGVQEGERLVRLMRTGAKSTAPEREKADWVLRPKGRASPGR